MSGRDLVPRSGTDRRGRPYTRMVRPEEGSSMAGATARALVAPPPPSARPDGLDEGERKIVSYHVREGYRSGKGKHAIASDLVTLGVRSPYVSTTRDLDGALAEIVERHRGSSRAATALVDELEAEGYELHSENRLRDDYVFVDDEV